MKTVTLAISHATIRARFETHEGNPHHDLVLRRPANVENLVAMCMRRGWNMKSFYYNDNIKKENR